MPLQRSLVEIPIQTGLSQKTDSRLVDAGAQTTLQNLVQDKLGALSKRKGILDLGSLQSTPWASYDALGNASYKDARLLPSQPNGLAQISGGRMWSRASNNTAYDLDSVTNVLVDEFGLQVADNSLQAFDMCTNGTSILVVWLALNASNVLVGFYAVFDATTYDVVQTPQQFASGVTMQTLRCVSINSTTAIIVAQATATINAYAFTWATFALSAATALTGAVGMPAGGCATSGSGGLTFYGNWDISPVQGSANFIIALGAAGGASNPKVYLATFNTSLTLVNLLAVTMNVLGTDYVHGVAVIASTTNNIVWCAAAVNHPSTNSIYCFSAPINLSGVSGGAPEGSKLWAESPGALPEQLTLIADPTVAAWTQVMVAGSLLATNSPMNWATLNTGTTIGGSWTRKGLFPAAKLFTVGNLILGLFYYTAGNPTFNGLSVLPTYFVCELQKSPSYNPAVADLRYMATVGPRIANAGLYINASLYALQCPMSSVISPLQVIMPASTIRNANSQSGIDLFNVYYSNALYQPAVLGDSSYISGGVACSFDGNRVINHGFPYQPPSVTTVIASTSGGGLSSYTYTYAAVYEWHMKTGERKQSQPTTATYACATSSGIASIQVPSLNLSLEQDWESGYAPAVGIAIYRDTVAAPGLLCRAFADAVPFNLLNSFNTTLTYTDSAADSTIQGNEQIYTTGNVLGAQVPPSLKGLITHQGRLAGIGGDGLVWMTTKWDEGTTQPYYNDALTMAVGDLGRPTALASMDGNLLIFKRDTIYIVSGDGPASDGTGNTWTPPQRITADVGCSTDWRGVCVFSQGVTFQSGAKLYVLSRGLEVAYFSGAVEDVLIANPVIVGSANNNASNELRFVCKPSELATTGVVLNFNYVTNTWSIHEYYDTDAKAVGSNIDACIVQNGSWYHATFTGRVYQEGTGASNSDNYYDCYTPIAGGQWIVGMRETSWLKTQGIQGFGRVWNAQVLETDFSPHDLFIQAAYNYGSLYTDVASWTAAAIASFSTPQPQMGLHLTQQIAESLRIKIYDGPPNGVASSTSGQGANIIGVTVEAGVLKGRYRLPESQSQ